MDPPGGDYELDDPYVTAWDHLADGDPEKALKAVETLGSDADPNRFHSVRAEALYALDRYAEAAESAFTALHAGYETKRLHSVIAGCLFTMGLTEEAQTHLRASGTDDKFSIHLSAWAAFRRKDYVEAERFASEALTLSEGGESLRCLHLAAQACQGNSEARATLREIWLQQRSTEAAKYLFYDARERNALHEVDGIAQELHLCTHLDADLAEYVMNYFIHIDEPQRALQLFSTLPSAIGEAHEIQYMVGYALFESDRIREALPYFRRAFEADPTRRLYFDGLARTLARLWKWSSTIVVICQHFKSTSRFAEMKDKPNGKVD